MRMGGVRKQYRNLGGNPLLVLTLRLFEVHPRVDRIVVAAPAADVSDLTELLREHDIHKVFAVVSGGGSRQASVAAALDAAPEDADIVMIHDAVRPFVPGDRIDAVLEAAERCGAAALAVPVADTLRRGDGDVFGATVDRAGLYRMQTPQAFSRDWFVEAHDAARSAGYEETDDAALVQRTGRAVAIVTGSRYNIKVTTPDDWALAEALWATRAQVLSGDA